MRKADPQEVIRLYVAEGLNTVEIAARVGVTHQAVSLILRRNQVKLGPKRYRLPAIDPELVWVLHLDEGRSIKAIAKLLRTSRERILQCMNKNGIEERRYLPANVLYPELRKINIGESVQVERRAGKQKDAYVRFYGMAKAAGIRVSLKTIDEKTMLLTRVE